MNVKIKKEDIKMAGLKAGYRIFILQNGEWKETKVDGIRQLHEAIESGELSITDINATETGIYIYTKEN